MALADLANIVLDPDIRLPVQVYHEKKTTTDVTINCLESDDLQGFKPLSKSSIGDVSYFKGSTLGSKIRETIKYSRIGMLKENILDR